MAKRSRVALIIETSTSYGRRILRGISRYARTRQSWSIFLEQRDLSGEPPPWITTWDGDGIISRITTTAMVEDARRLKIPLIDLTDRHETFSSHRVWSDDATIARLGAEHLIERGFHNFGFCGFSNEIWSDRRRDGFVNVVGRAGWPCRTYESPWFGRDAHPWEVEQERIMDWLRALPKPAGVMTCNDYRGQHVLDACVRLDLAVPEEVAVIGVDDEEELCELCEPPLSSVVPNAEMVGYKAAELLDQLMSGGTARQPRLEVPPIEVVTRQSTDVLAIEDPEIAAAVRYIRENACQGAKVEDILDDVPLSRSILERRFRKYLGHSPQALIRQTRLKRVKQLLVDTDLTLAKISTLAGFRHQEHMCVLFKKEIGESPGAYRRKVQGANPFIDPATRRQRRSAAPAPPP